VTEPAEFFEEPVTQPCSPACRYFEPMPGDAWTDYGRCLNPRSPLHGYPVSLDRECRCFETATGPQQSASSQAEASANVYPPSRAA